MRRLVLGGTGFVGRHIVECALAGATRSRCWIAGAARPACLKGSSCCAAIARAAFALDLTSARATGTYNAVGEDLTWDEMLAACCALGRGATPIWVSDARLMAEGIGASRLALWIPGSDLAYAGLFRIGGARAAAAGLRHRPLAQTARDTYAALRPADGPGLDPALEAAHRGVTMRSTRP